MRFLHSVMTIVGWAFVIAAILSMLGMGSMHMHFGPLDLKFPFHIRW